MLSLIQFNLITLVAALLIGVAAGRWAFARKRPADNPKPRDSDPS
jgi:hypothetical protein